MFTYSNTVFRQISERILPCYRICLRQFEMLYLPSTAQMKTWHYRSLIQRRVTMWRAGVPTSRSCPVSLTGVASQQSQKPFRQIGRACYEFLAEATYISVDPYQRVKLGQKFPCDMIGGQIAKIIESKNPDYPVGAWVMGHFGWRTHTVVNPNNSKLCDQKPYLYVLPFQHNEDLPISLGLGVCGRVGNSAYFGFTQICQPRPGENVVVSGAAGAVGSHVGQIAKILGCKVIGIAGTDEKCGWLTTELNFDFAINYKTEDIAKFLRENVPGGVDCYFDNVGGAISSAVISQMNEFGRIAVCGAISSYNETDPEKLKAPTLQPYIVGKQLKMEGFQVNRFADRTLEGIKQNLEWVKQGKLKYQENIYNGFDSAVDAFIGLFRGSNIGKSIVKVK